MQEAIDWQAWFEKADVSVEKRAISAITFNQADHAIDMALQGTGVSLARHSIACGSLERVLLLPRFPSPSRLTLSIRSDAQRAGNSALECSVL